VWYFGFSRRTSLHTSLPFYYGVLRIAPFFYGYYRFQSRRICVVFIPSFLSSFNHLHVRSGQSAALGLIFQFEKPQFWVHAYLANSIVSVIFHLALVIWEICYVIIYHVVAGSSIVVFLLKRLGSGIPWKAPILSTVLGTRHVWYKLRLCIMFR
jgi:hypothetical protein